MSPLEKSIKTGIITTLTGKDFDLFDPKPEQIDIEDIASGLANKGHYSGLTPFYFSIAQHSIMVMEEYETSFFTSGTLKLLALLHDASEAYIGDMVKPLKVHMPDFVSVEDRIMKAIAKKFNLPLENKHLIKPFDLFVQEIEYNAFYRNGSGIDYMSPEKARYEFLKHFNRLYS